LALGAEPGVTRTEVKLGATVPMTGPLAFYGEMTKGSRGYFQKINEKGGVNGRKIDLVIEDDAYSAARTVPATRKLVEQDNVFAIFQALGPAHAAVVPYLKKKKVPDLFISEGSKVFTNNPLSFRGILPWDADGRAMATLVSKRYPGKTVGILFENDDVGKEQLEGAKGVLASTNKIVVEQSYDPGATQADTQLQNLVNAKPDVVLLFSVPNITAITVKQGAEKNFKPVWVSSFINAIPELILLAGNASEGLIAGAFYKLPSFDEASPSLKEHQSMLDKYYPGTKAGIMTVHGQAMAEMFVEALRRAPKELTRTNLVSAVESIKDFTCSVCLFPTSLSASNHDVITKETFLVVKGGKYTPLKDPKLPAAM